tara:strand:- start:40 stop:888 length:849 start_codon:yes stop_codon:yes gene_type:complete
MQITKFLCLIILIIPLISCSNNKINKSQIKEKDLESQVLEAYEEGLKSLKDGDVIFASKKFNEAETLFPQSKWAPKSSLMAAYSYYSQDYYEDSILELERFLEIYPFHENIDYAYYLLGLCWYEQIIDEKKDLQTIIKAKEKFSYLIKNFPNTEYALDAEFKIDLINDTLAAKEMYVGRYYFNQKKWIPAINRFRIIVDDYETTIYTEEALHRLVEVYYTIGLKDEAKKYATLLGYNYQSSQWYEKSYSVFDKMYEKNKKKMINQNKKKERSILKKFKSLLN